MGAGKTCYSLVMGSGSFRTDCQGGFWVGGPCTALSPGLKGGGLESQFGRGLGPHDKRVVDWSCLCLGYKRGVCFWGTQLGALIRESPDYPVQLVYGLAS